jgi:hypothetical protein
LALARSRDREPARATSPTTTAAPAAGAAPSTTRAPTTTARRETTSTSAAAAPVGGARQRLEDGNAGYAISYPTGWQVRKGSGNVVDLVEPGTGTYLRIDWSDQPKDPLEAWQASSRSFGATHAGYEELRLEETTFKGWDGAIWEYRYGTGGSRLHATNLTFVPSEDRAFALNFQTAESRWEASQDLREQLEDSFTFTKKKKD